MPDEDNLTPSGGSSNDLNKPAANDIDAWQRLARKLEDDNKLLTRQVDTYKGHATKWQTDFQNLDQEVKNGTSALTGQITDLTTEKNQLASKVTGYESTVQELQAERDRLKAEFEGTQKALKLQTMVATEYPQLLDVYQDLKLEGTDEDIKAILDRANGKFGATVQQKQQLQTAGGAPPTPTGNVPTETAADLERQLNQLRSDGKQGTSEYTSIRNRWIVELGK